MKGNEVSRMASNATAKAVFLVSSFAAPAVAWADLQTGDLQVPEPETLALLGVGAVAMLVARWVGRRK